MDSPILQRELVSSLTKAGFVQEGPEVFGDKRKTCSERGKWAQESLLTELFWIPAEINFI